MNVIIFYVVPFYIVEGFLLIAFFLFFRLRYTCTILCFLYENKYITLEYFNKLKNYIEGFGVMPLRKKNNDVITAIDELWKIFRKSYLAKKNKKIYILQMLYKNFYTMLIVQISICILFVIMIIVFVIMIIVFILYSVVNTYT